MPPRKTAAENKKAAPVTKKVTGDKAGIPSRKDEIDALAATINKAYKGRGAVQTGAEFSNVFLLRRPTGITQMDLALGGGFPAGGLSQIAGKDGATKSWLANQVIANVQRIYGNDSAIALCMTEMAYDKWFAKLGGVRIAFSEDEIRMYQQHRVLHNQPPYTEEELRFFRDQLGVITHSMYATAEELLEVAVQQVESNLFQVVLIDSFGALLTAAEAEADGGIADKHRGGAAMAITQFMHRLHAALNMPDKYGRPNTTTVLGINQYRDNVNAGLYGNPMKLAGGWALKHGKLVDIILDAGKALRIEASKGVFKQVGKEINWALTKGKAGCHDGPKGSYSFYYGDTPGYSFGADKIEDLLIASVTLGIVQQAGAWVSYKDKKWNGKEAAKVDIFNDLSNGGALFSEIQSAVFNASGLSFILKEEQL